MTQKSTQNGHLLDDSVTATSYLFVLKKPVYERSEARLIEGIRVSLKVQEKKGIRRSIHHMPEIIFKYKTESECLRMTCMQNLWNQNTRLTLKKSRILKHLNHSKLFTSRYFFQKFAFFFLFLFHVFLVELIRLRYLPLITDPDPIFSLSHSLSPLHIYSHEVIWQWIRPILYRAQDSTIRVKNYTPTFEYTRQLFRFDYQIFFTHCILAKLTIRIGSMCYSPLKYGAKKTSQITRFMGKRNWNSIRSKV